MDRFLTEDELDSFGIKRGDNCKIARTATLTEPEKITLGNNCLISDYALITGRFIAGDWCHLAHYSHISGGNLVEFGDFVGVSARCSFYTSNDNFRGESLWGPCPDSVCKKTDGPIILKDYVLIGWNCLFLPNTLINSYSIFDSRMDISGIYLGQKKYKRNYVTQELPNIKEHVDTMEYKLREIYK